MGRARGSLRVSQQAKQRPRRLVRRPARPSRRGWRPVLEVFAAGLAAGAGAGAAGFAVGLAGAGVQAARSSDRHETSVAKCSVAWPRSEWRTDILLWVA
jgi:hypothetical protein